MDRERMEAVVREFLAAIGDDPDREGLRDTPRRVVNSWRELFAGYQQDPATVCTTFDECYDQMVVLKGFEFYSFCEHHVLPFWGTMSVGYIPRDKILGLSKLARVSEMFARRLQLQERLGHQIAEAIENLIHPLGVGVVIRARHLCVCARGVGKQHGAMVTSVLRGRLRDDDKARKEFLDLCAGGGE